MPDGATVTSVRLGGTPVSQILSSSLDTVVVVAAFESVESDVLGDVAIFLDTGFRVVLSDAWTYKITGAISLVSPSSGHSGTRVTINGTNLLGYGATVAAVTLGGQAATVVAASDTAVTVVVQDRTAGVGDVEIVSDSGAVVRATGAWTYVAQATITSVAPASGQHGTRVTIRGGDLLMGGAQIVAVVLHVHISHTSMYMGTHTQGHSYTWTQTTHTYTHTCTCRLDHAIAVWPFYIGDCCVLCVHCNC